MLARIAPLAAFAVLASGLTCGSQVDDAVNAARAGWNRAGAEALSSLKPPASQRDAGEAATTLVVCQALIGQGTLDANSLESAYLGYTGQTRESVAARSLTGLGALNAWANGTLAKLDNVRAILDDPEASRQAADELGCDALISAILRRA